MPARFRCALAIATILALLCACAGPGYQVVPQPVAGSSVPAGDTRIYLVRHSQAAGSWRNVKAFDGDTAIGEFDEDEYLCWDRKARQGVLRVIFEGLDRNTKAVESFAELPAEPDTTVWFGLSIERDTRKPIIERMEPAAARARLKELQPAEVRR